MRLSLYCRQKQYLQRVAALAARSGEPLTAMRLLHALAARCALDPEARMHVCTALHVHNNFRTLYERLHACFTLDDFVELFECVQHAYGTRVFRDVTCNHVPNLVRVVTMYRVWVIHVDVDHNI